MAEEDSGLYMFPDLWGKSNNLSVVTQLSRVISGRSSIQKMSTFKPVNLFLTEWLLDTLTLSDVG